MLSVATQYHKFTCNLFRSKHHVHYCLHLVLNCSLSVIWFLQYLLQITLQLLVQENMLVGFPPRLNWCIQRLTQKHALGKRMSNEKQYSKKEDRTSISTWSISYNIVSQDSKRLVPEPHVLWRWTSSILQAFNSLPIWLYCKVTACAGNNIQSYRISVFFPQSSACCPRHKIFVISWIQPLIVSFVSLGFVCALESQASAVAVGW